jgi:XTP/dITP diphosphohydrolase
VQTLLIATGNPGKYREMSRELAEVGIETRSLEDEGISLERPESGDDYLENARIKADEGHEKSGLPTLADDSGLEVEALGGDPGVHSDRWAGEDADNADRNRKLLHELEDVPEDRRSAEFVCRMVLLDDGQTVHVTEGRCAGRIAESPRGDQGFGYDPLFEVKGKDWKTFGELAPRVKKRISHRARALDKMISWITSDQS